MKQVGHCANHPASCEWLGAVPPSFLSACIGMSRGDLNNKLYCKIIIKFNGRGKDFHI